MRKHLIDIIFIVLVILATSAAWHGILNQVIEGEGFYYFSPAQSLITPAGKLTDLAHGVDNFTKIITFVQEKIFAGNIESYMTVEFLFIILINISFYIFVRKVTKNPYLAFMAAIYEAVYYTGNFQFYARGHYHWFYQRAVEIIPIFVSFFFIIKFCESKTLKNYLFSLFFFVVALFMANYTTFLTPFIPIYLTIHALTDTKNKKLKQKIKLVLFSLPFLLINYLVTKDASLNLSVIHPNQTFIQSFLLLKDIPHKILYQLTVVTIPFAVTDFLSKQFHLNYQQFIDSSTMFVCLLYLMIFGNLYKNKSKYFKLSLTSFFALLSVLFLIVYFNRVIVYNEVQEGRYYYIPAFYVGIIFASFLETIIKGKKKLIIISLLTILWLFANSNFIWKKIASTQYYSIQTKLMLNYLNTIKDNLPENAFVLLPDPPEPGATAFLIKYYSGKNTTFLYLDQNWKSKLPENVDKNKVFVFDFKEKFKIEDQSEKYRLQL